MAEIHYLKTYLLSLLLTAILLVGCAEKKRTDPVVGVDVTTLEKKNGANTKFEENEVEDLSAATDMKSILCQDWEYYEDAKDAHYADPSGNIEVVYRGYSIFSDGTLIKDPRGNIRAGSWEIDDQSKPIQLHFKMDDGSVETNELAYLMPFEMKLAKNAGGKKELVDLRSEGTRYRDSKRDPFYLANNLWRFKPAKPESDLALKARLKACIHFYVLFYDHQIKSDAKEVLFTGLPSCFKWYGGGIYLQKEKELDQKWISSFYNRDDAMKAYALADKLISIKFEWPKKERNWLKLNVAVLRQMETKIDEL